MRKSGLVFTLCVGLVLSAAPTAAVFAIEPGGSPATAERLQAESETAHAEHFTEAPTPAVSGLVGVGETLTANPGTWSPAPDVLSYQWLRSSQPIAGATWETYTATPEDLGAILSVTVTATKAGFEQTERTSVASQRVEPGSAPVANQLRAFSTSVAYTTPDWDASPPWENPVYPQPTPNASTVTLPGSIVQREVQAHPNGYTVGRPAKPNHIVLHHTAGTSLQGAINTLYGDDYAPTASYVVKDNELVSMVDEYDSPWTNGRWTSNLYSVTFEMVNGGWARSNGTWPSPSASTKETTAWAMARAAQRWGMELPLQYGVNVFGHRDVSKTSTACPGELDVQAVVNRANEILGSRQFVTAAYQDVLGRAPEAEGLSYWMSRLASGMPRGDMANAFNNSEEYYRIKIREAYNLALNREPEPAGMAYWLDRLQRRELSPENIYATFLFADEMYLVQGGGTNVGYVTALYQELLNRDPEPEGLQYWLGRLSSEPRRVISDGFWFSDEKYYNRVRDSYQLFLGRSADAGAVTYWSWYAKTYGTTAMRAGIMGSDEYWNRAITRFGT